MYASNMRVPGEGLPQQIGMVNQPQQQVNLSRDAELETIIWKGISPSMTTCGALLNCTCVQPPDEYSVSFEKIVINGRL